MITRANVMINDIEKNGFAIVNKQDKEITLFISNYYKKYLIKLNYKTSRAFVIDKKDGTVYNAVIVKKI